MYWQCHFYPVARGGAVWLAESFGRAAYSIYFLYTKTTIGILHMDSRAFSCWHCNILTSSGKRPPSSSERPLNQAGQRIGWRRDGVAADKSYQSRHLPAQTLNPWHCSKHSKNAAGWDVGPERLADRAAFATAVGMETNGWNETQHRSYQRLRLRMRYPFLRDNAMQPENAAESGQLKSVWAFLRLFCTVVVICHYQMSIPADDRSFKNTAKVNHLHKAATLN